MPIVQRLFLKSFIPFLSCFIGGNAKLRYQITSGNTGGVFDVEPEVGTIFIAQRLDYEQNKRWVHETGMKLEKNVYPL